MNQEFKSLCYQLALVVVTTAVLLSTCVYSDDRVKVFVLAGQSNMEGQAVVWLSGKDYNDGKGTLGALLKDQSTASRFAHLSSDYGQGKPRHDVFVRYQPENRDVKKGPLDFGFTAYEDKQHFGPELQFGHVLGDYFDCPVLLVKTAWGGKSLYEDFRPPSSGGATGKYYSLMVSQVKEALANIHVDFPTLRGYRPELSGLVWYQGWNDGVQPHTAVPQYERNLVNLIRDFRREFAIPDLPVVIGELTGPWVNAPPEWEKLRSAQSATTSIPEFHGNVEFVPTRNFVREPNNSPNPGHGHHEFGNAETIFLVGEALGRGMLTLLQKTASSSLQLTLPQDYQVVQRSRASVGHIPIRGTAPTGALIEARLRSEGLADTEDWKPVKVQYTAAAFAGVLEAPAGGWYQLQVRARLGDTLISSAAVEHVGVGEVFVVAGQSNSANHGEKKRSTITGRVAAFDGHYWQIANDPQPGASGKGGSFMPDLGDELSKKFDVPIGFIACGIGATSVREWLPAGAKFPNPPTIESRVQKLPNGEWASLGSAFQSFVSRMKSNGPNSFRAVLWHQGESDANQKDTSRTLAGGLYRQYLEDLIRESRREIAWEAPWFVAQVSYHVPGDEASPEIREAQASLWRDGVALEGPDSDALTEKFRERNGQGVHFSEQGLREHARRWFEKISPWIEKQLQEERRR